MLKTFRAADVDNGGVVSQLLQDVKVDFAPLRPKKIGFHLVGLSRDLGMGAVTDLVVIH